MILEGQRKASGRDIDLKSKTEGLGTETLCWLLWTLAKFQLASLLLHRHNSDIRSKETLFVRLPGL